MGQKLRYQTNFLTYSWGSVLYDQFYGVYFQVMFGNLTIWLFNSYQLVLYLSLALLHILSLCHCFILQEAEQLILLLLQHQL